MCSGSSLARIGMTTSVRRSDSGSPGRRRLSRERVSSLGSSGQQERPRQRRTQSFESGRRGSGLGGQYNVVCTHRAQLCSCCRLQPSAHAIPHDRPSETLGHHYAHPGVSRVVRPDPEAEHAISRAGPLRPHSLKVGGVPESVLRLHRTGAGVRRSRPFRRRRLMTRTPPGVDIRARNPCVLRR